MGTFASQAQSIEQSRFLRFYEILVIDDREFDMARLRREFAKVPAALNLTETACKEAFQRQLARKTFDAVVIDYALADCTGFEAVQACIKSRLNHHAKRVMISGYESPELATHAAGAGFDHYLNKRHISSSMLFDLLIRDEPSPGQDPQDVESFLHSVRDDNFDLKPH